MIPLFINIQERDDWQIPSQQQIFFLRLGQKKINAGPTQEKGFGSRSILPTTAEVFLLQTELNRFSVNDAQ